MNPTHFFIFSLGPVQSFIAQARKAQDLYLGCRMISDYCRYAAILFEDKGGTVIFPKIDSTSITNRFVGLISLPNQDTEEADGKRIGEEITKAVQNRFVKEGLQAIRAGLGNSIKPEDITGMREQLEAHLQTYWVFSRYDSQDYAGSYQEAERVFGMSKHLRTPKVLTYQGADSNYDMFASDFLGETGRKCIVDGELNVKIYRWSEEDKGRYGDNNSRLLMHNKLFLSNRREVVLVGRQADEGPFVSIKQVPPKFIQDGEGLSAVSFFKRCYLPDGTDHKGMKNAPDYWDSKGYSGEKFFQDCEVPTTAKIALLDVLTNAKDDMSCRLKNLICNARPVDFASKYPGYRAEEEELYFEENLTETYFRKQLLDETKREEIRTAQQNFKLALSKEGIQLQPYYALVAFDIDGLGKHLQKCDTQEAHKDIAGKLNDFANKVSELIKSDTGLLLHAGGDDFLLMLNLHRLFDTLIAIRALWDKLFTDLTYSTSVLISHYKAPLTRAVKTVKAELKTVKTRFKHEGKNGVSFCFMAKSGAVSTCYFKQDKLTLLFCLFSCLQSKKYSPKFIFQFAQNMEEMGFDGATNAEEQESIRAFASSELQRLLIRARDTNKVTHECAAHFGDQFNVLLSEQVRDSGELLDISNFVQFLKMAELAAKHTNIWPKGTSK